MNRCPAEPRVGAKAAVAQVSGAASLPVVVAHDERNAGRGPGRFAPSARHDPQSSAIAFAAACWSRSHSAACWRGSNRLGGYG